MDRTQQPPIAMHKPSSGRRKTLVGLLLPLLAIGLAWVFMQLGRNVAILATGLLIALIWGPALWRSRRLQRAWGRLPGLLARWDVRLLIVLAMLGSVALALSRLHGLFARLALLALAAGLLLLVARHRWAQWLLRHFAKALRWLFGTRLLRWISFSAVALLVMAWLGAMPPRYSSAALLAMIVAALPLAYAQLRGGDSAAMLARSMGLMAVLFAMLAVHALENLELTESHVFSSLLALAAGALAISLLKQRQSGLLEALPEPGTMALSPGRLNRLDRVVFGLGLLLWLIFTEANGRLLGITALNSMHVHSQFALLLSSLGLMVLGYAGLLRWPLLRRPRIDRVTLLVLLVTLLALGLRFHTLESGLRQFVDEINFASVVDGFWNRPDVPLMEAMSGIAAFPFIYPYWQAMAVDVFGHNLIGLRAISAILGALTIPAMYLLGRAAFDRKTGLLAALLLATFPPHIHFSRLGMNNIADPLVGTLALAFLMRGFRWQRRVDYILGGVFLGMTHYFYEGGRLVFTPLLAAWLVGMIYLWFPRIKWRQVLLVALMTLIVALPIYYTLMVDRSSLLARFERNEQALGGDYWDKVDSELYWLEVHFYTHILRPVLVMLRDVEGSFFYRGEDGLVTPPLVPLVMVGLGLAVLRLRSPGMLLLLGWWLITILGNSLMVAPDHAPRFAVVFPALMLLAALALRYLWPLLSPRRGRWLLLALLAGVLALYQGNYYFNDYLPTYRLQLYGNKAHPDDHDAVYRSLYFPAQTTLHFVSTPVPDHLYLGALIHFMRDNLYLRVLEPAALRPEYLYQIDRGMDHAFFIEQGADEAVAVLERYFYLLPPQYSPYPEVPREDQYVLYYAPYLGDYSDSKLAQLEVDLAEGPLPLFGP